MSKNFELVTQVVDDRELFVGVPQETPPSPSLRAVSRPSEPVRGEVAMLAQRVFLLSGDGVASRAVVFCGIERGSGTSWLCAKVARAVAAQGAKRVCAVDVNLHAPALHSYLRVANRSGLADAVRCTGSIRDFLQPGAGDNLWVLPAGPDAASGSILASERFRERVAELRAEFDFVIFDAPAITDSGDAALIGQMSDGVVVVVGANSTRRETARKAKESLDAAHVRLLGTVLNKRTFPIPEALYRRL